MNGVALVGRDHVIYRCYLVFWNILDLNLVIFQLHNRYRGTIQSFENIRVHSVCIFQLLCHGVEHRLVVLACHCEVPRERRWTGVSRWYCGTPESVVSAYFQFQLSVL